MTFTTARNLGGYALLPVRLTTNTSEPISSDQSVPSQAPGEIIYNGERFSSPSAAASAVRQGGAANGWAFWGVIRDGQPVPLAVLRAELDAQ